MSDTYWHLFTGVVTDPEMHVTSIIGPSTLAPDDLTESGIPVRDLTMPAGFGAGDLTYAASFDHEPTEAEKTAHTPAEFRVEADPDTATCTFCEDHRDDLTTSGDVAICGDCMAIAEVDGETR